MAASHSSSPPASWIAIGSLAVSTFALVTTELLPIGLLPEIAHGTGVTHGEAGLTVTMTGFVSAIAAPLSIAFVGHIDRRRVLLVLLGLLALSNLIVATATGLPQLLAGRFVLGITVGSFWTIAGSLGPRLRQGAAGIRASALIMSGISIGTVAGVPAGALIGHLFGWRVAFGAAAGVAAVAMAALTVLLPAIAPKEGSGIREFPVIIQERRARIGLIAAVLAFVGQFTAYTYIAPFLEGRAGIHAGFLSAVLLASGAAGFFGNLFGGYLSGRDVRSSVMTMALLLGGSVLLLDFVGHNAPAAVALVIVWGFAFGMLPIALQSWMFVAVPDHLEGMQALFVSVAQIAIGGGALIGGTIVDHAGIGGALVAGSAAALASALYVTVSTSKRRGNAKTAAAPAIL